MLVEVELKWSPTLHIKRTLITVFEFIICNWWAETRLYLIDSADICDSQTDGIKYSQQEDVHTDVLNIFKEKSAYLRELIQIFEYIL